MAADGKVVETAVNTALVVKAAAGAPEVVAKKAAAPIPWRRMRPLTQFAAAPG